MAAWRAPDGGDAMTSDQAKPGLGMTLEEAYVLHGYHKTEEAAAAAHGDYDHATRHRDRNRTIGAWFWPADAWERAYGDVASSRPEAKP